jgi:DNA-binding phage protein
MPRVYLATLSPVAEALPSFVFGGHVTPRSDNARYIARLEREARAGLARRLPELMARRGIGARELARRSRVAINTIYGTLAGETTPKLGNLLALAAGLDVTLDQLLGPPAGELLVADSLASEWDASA